jgi:hypothetical protein
MGSLAAACLWVAIAAPVAADPPGPPLFPQLAALGDRPAPFQPRPRARPFEPARPDLRCTPDNAHCITLARYIPDVCQTIEATAAEAGLEVDFFARLLWKESLYDAGAVSPVGAEGIAQFMPGTARLRGLDDPFNPAKALRASATYLAELRDRYGNLGLAAAAYNAGEARVDDFLAVNRRLPPETRRYVHAITGHSGEAWRDTPPETLDLALDTARPFQDACMELARNRSLQEFRIPSTDAPWGVILAAHRSVEIVRNRYAVLSRENAIVGNHEGSFVRVKLPGRVGRAYTAQIGVQSRKEGNRLCGRLRNSGVGCFVLRN